MNPRIVRADGDDRDLEGCLSIPGYVAYVTRREQVWVVAQNRQGRKYKVAGSGLLGRALQHELDHLDGKLYIDYLDSMDELIAVGRGDDDEDDDDVEPSSSGAGSIPSGRRRSRAADVERARTVFFGSGAFAVPVLARGRRVTSRLDLVGVVTAPPRPAGRSAPSTPTPVGVAAAGLEVPVLAPERLREPGFLDRLAALGPSLGVLADYGQIVPPAVLDLPPHGILNLHPSLLPRHRGATPIPATILAGDADTGVTLIRMDDGLDTGPIVAAEPTPLGDDEDAPALEARLAERAADLLARVVGPYLARRGAAGRPSRSRASR